MGNNSAARLYHMLSTWEVLRITRAERGYSVAGPRLVARFNNGMIIGSINEAFLKEDWLSAYKLAKWENNEKVMHIIQAGLLGANNAAD